MRRDRALKTVLLTALAWLPLGCGYHVAGHYDSLPKSIHVIAVPALENKTTSYRIEQKLTAATVHEFLAKTRYRIVSDPNGGDAILRGKVLSVEVIPLTFVTNTTPSTNPTTTPPNTNAQASSMLVVLRCEVTLTQRDNDKILYRNDNFVFRNEYELATGMNKQGVIEKGDLLSYFQEGDPAVDRMAQDFAGRLVAAVTENF